MILIDSGRAEMSVVTWDCVRDAATREIVNRRCISAKKAIAT
jgi:hypothetical protein